MFNSTGRKSVKRQKYRVIWQAMVLDKSYTRPGSKVFLSLAGKICYLGHLILDEMIIITFIKYEKPCKIKSDMKRGRQLKIGPEILHAQVLKRWLPRNTGVT